MTYNEIISIIPEFLHNSETYSLVITDLEGKYIFVNEIFKKRFLFMNIDFIGQPFSLTIHPEDIEKYNIASYECITNPSKTVKIQVRKPDTHIGNFYLTEWEFSLFKDQNGQPVGVLCLGHDITETERASRNAKVFAQKAETIIEEITDGFYILDKDWRFIKMNKAAELLFGVPREKVLGRNIWDIFPDTPDYSYPAQFRKAMNEYLTVNFEDYWADLDRWFSAVVYPSQEGLTVFFKEITQERKTQFDLEDTANKLKSILDSTLNSYILINPRGKIVDFNQTAQELALKYVQKTLVINTDIRDFFILESKEVFDELFEKALQGEKSVIEIKRTIEEKEIWFETHYLPVYKEKTNELIGVTLKTVNIDDRKKAEIQLKYSENKLRAIMESTTDSNILISPDYKILSFNKRASEVSQIAYGKPLQELADVWEYVVQSDKADFYRDTQKALKGEYLRFEREIFFENFSAWFEVSYFPVHDNEGKILGITFNTTNIDARKKAEIQLKQSETMLRALYDSRSEASTFIDKDFRIVFNNKLAQEITKSIFGKEALKGDKNLDFMIPALREEFHDYYKRVLEGESIQVEKEYLDKWWRFSLYPVYDSENNIIGIADNVKDVTGRVQNELKIRKQNESLKKIAWQQSHEVRRPLATILGLCDLLSTDENATVEQQQQYINYILQSVRELDTIIHKIVDYTHDIE